MNSLVFSLQRSVHLLKILLSAFLIALFTLMLSAVLVQIVGRYVFNYSIAGASEVATFSQVWLVLVGSGLAMSRHQHVAIDFLPAKLPVVLARIAMVSVAAVIIGFLTALAYAAMPLMKMGMIQTSPALKLPMWIMYLSIPVGTTYIALALVSNVCLQWRAPFSRASATDSEISTTPRETMEESS